MDELPAIIHRLSLRLWVPEYRAREERDVAQSGATSEDEPVVDPFALPPQDPVDSHGHKLNPSEIASLSIETGIETQSLFSQKNLLRLAALTDSHRTLSLFTPSIQDVVFRAWAGPNERGEVGGLRSPGITPALSRSHSYSGGTSTSYTFDGAPHGRPAVQSFGSYSYGLNMGAGRHGKGHGARQRKKRVVNLRKGPSTGKSEPGNEDNSSYTDSASVTESTGSAPSIFSAPLALSQELRDEYREPATPPRSPHATIRQGKLVEPRSAAPFSAMPRDEGLPPARRTLAGAFETSPPPKGYSANQEGGGQENGQNFRSYTANDLDTTRRASVMLPGKTDAVHTQQHVNPSAAREKSPEAGPSTTSHTAPLPNFIHFITDPANGGTILEQAWMMKMAGEIARRYQEEREKGTLGGETEAPPAYVG